MGTGGRASVHSTVQLNLSSIGGPDLGGREKTDFLRGLEAFNTYDKPKAWEYVASTVKIRDRLEDHEVIFGNDKMMPRNGNGSTANRKNLQQRYFAARRNALLLGAMGEEQLEASRTKKRKSLLVKNMSIREYHEEEEVVDTPTARVWRNSRLGRVFQEFGQSSDWVCTVLLKNAVAAVIQAHWRGMMARRRWQQDPKKVVADIKAAAARVAAEAEEARHRRALQHALVAKAKGHGGAVAVMDGKQMLIAHGVLAKAFGNKNTKGPTGKWGAAKSKAVADVRSRSTDPDDEASGSGSDVSDFELDTLESLKMRSRTPPWISQEGARDATSSAAMQHSRPQRGNVDVLWDPTECQYRLDQARERRAQRGPPPPVSDVSPADTPLPPDLVNDMLLDRYIEKYQRLGLLKDAKAIKAGQPPAQHTQHTAQHGP